MNTTNLNPNRNVMLVDSCSVCNYVNNKILLSYGFTKEVITYTSGPKALKHLNQIPDSSQMPEYIFVNLDMRIMDGNQFVEEFEKLPENLKRKTKVVLLSSSINPADFKQIAKNRNVFAHMSRPLIKNNIDQLVEMSKQFAFAA